MALPYDPGVNRYHIFGMLKYQGMYNLQFATKKKQCDNRFPADMPILQVFLRILSSLTVFWHFGVPETVGKR